MAAFVVPSGAMPYAYLASMQLETGISQIGGQEESFLCGLMTASRVAASPLLPAATQHGVIFVTIWLQSVELFDLISMPLPCRLKMHGQTVMPVSHSPVAGLLH